MGYVDLHSHVLGGLDDGAPDLPTSMAMLGQLAAIGYTEVCATPHQKASQFLPAWHQVERTYAATREALVDGKVKLELHLGAENYWDHVFFERSQEKTIPTYRKGSAFLFEIPTEELPLRFEETLFQIQMKGFLPVMAHPERYGPFVDKLDRLARLGESCALVVDLGAVAGYHGARATKMARRLLTDGLAHAAASDVHTVSDVRAAAEGIAWIKRKLGDDAARRLLDENPRCILAGRLPA